MTIVIFFALLIIILLFFLLKGIFSPQLGVSLIFLTTCGVIFFCFSKNNNHIQKSLLTEKEVKSKPEATENTEEKEIFKKSPKSKILEEQVPQKKESVQEVKKYLTSIKIKGIAKKSTLERFTRKSGYTLSKKGDYTLEFTHTGSSRQSDKLSEDNRFIYSGGYLIVKVNGDKCCCAQRIKIPQGLPLGKTMKVANQTLSETIENYVSNNLSIIIPMVTECLPQI